VRTYSDKWQFNYLFFQNEIIADKKQEQVKQSIQPSTCSIIVGGFVKKSFEQRIKKIQQFMYSIHHLFKLVLL
jgi:hypothetical protein